MQLISIYANAGISSFESPCAEYGALPLSLDELLVNHPSSTFLARVSGESMVDFGIFDGDVLIVDRSLTVANGDVIVGFLNSNFICKCIDTKNRMLLSSDGYDPLQISENDEFNIEGIVVSSKRAHRSLSLLQPIGE